MAQRESDGPSTVEEADGRSVTVSAQPIAEVDGPTQPATTTAPYTMIGFGVPVDPSSEPAG